MVRCVTLTKEIHKDPITLVNVKKEKKRPTSKDPRPRMTAIKILLGDTVTRLHHTPRNLYASDSISGSMIQCWLLGVTSDRMVWHHGSVLQLSPQSSNISIFYCGQSARCLHCFIGDCESFNLRSLIQKKPHKMKQGGSERGCCCPAVKLDLLAASLFDLVRKTAGSRLSICGEHLFHCATQGGNERTI